LPWTSNRRLAIAVIAGLTALVLFVPDPFRAQWAGVLADSAHGPVCGIIAAIVFRLTASPRRSTHRRWLIAVAATTSLGIAIELVQSQIGRDAQFTDVVTDFLGALAGGGLSLFFSTRASGYSRWRRHAGLISALLASALLVAPVAIMAASYAARNARFPVLMDGNAMLGAAFVTPYWLEHSRETLPPDAKPLFKGEKGLHVRATGQPRWSVALGEVQRDWSPYATLVIELFNPATKSVQLQLRVYDQADGLVTDLGFETRRTLEPHERVSWRIPLQEMRSARAPHPIDVRHVHGLLFFSVTGDPNPDLFVLNMRLE